MQIQAGAELHFQKLNNSVRESKDSEIVIDNCIGQRFIAAGLENKTITINGTPGNALGAYLNGATIYVNGNAQDAIGDTMNGGKIIVHGDAGDAVGYAMRGGRIYIGGNVGYRAGIHMKAYQDNKPIVVIGGRCGSFLGEYQAGGNIIVLGLNTDEKPIISYFCGTGMHGGQMYLRCDKIPMSLPKQVKAERIEKITDEEIIDIISDYCKEFNYDEKEILNHTFYKLTPDSNNPYRQMYVNN